MRLFVENFFHRGSQFRVIRVGSIALSTGNCFEIEKAYNVGDFEKDALEILEDIFNRFMAF